MIMLPNIKSAPRVSKHTVERFSIYVGGLNGSVLEFDRAEAVQIYHDLAEVLGFKSLKEFDCGSRMGHEAHFTAPGTYCSGRSRDMT